MDRKRARERLHTLHVDAPSGARVGRCAGCRRAFYSREGGTHCQVCAAPAGGAALHTCPACGYQWEGPGAGEGGDACPMLGCAGRVAP
jgi:hypothetical protein